MSKKKSRSSKNPSKPASRVGHYDVLDTNGLKTSGLNSEKSIRLKGVDRYQVKADSNLKPQLEQEKERAAQTKALLERLHPGCQAPEAANYSGLSLMGKDLERARFRNSSLKNCSFHSGKLRGTHWKNCNLSGVNFRKADLRDCILDGCNLTGADLRYANLEDARILDCELYAANFDNSTLSLAIIDHCDMGAQTFHNSNCKGIKLYSSQIIHGFFDNADFSGAEIRNTLFRSCTLTHTSFLKARIDDTVLKGCDSFDEGPVFSGARMNNVTMKDCEFHAVEMAGTRLVNCLWERVDMDSALLDDTEFRQVNFNESFLKDCYSLEKSPTFNQCRLDHLVIDQADLAQAQFSQSSFIATTIRDSDFARWNLQHTGLDPETVIENSD